MLDKRPGDSMVEISDIDDEPTTPNPELAPRIVIEYRDRGIPWMLIPPLLALSAVITTVVVYNVNARMNKRRPTVTVAAVAKDSVPLETLRLDVGSPAPSDPVAVTPEPARMVDKPSPSLVEANPAGDRPTLPSVPVLDPSGMLANVPLAEPDLSIVPKVPALGFDPTAIDNPVIPADPVRSAPMDRNLAPVRQPGPGNEPLPGMVAADQPAEVDPQLLPPDPRKAKLERQRRMFEAYRKAEMERGEFHAKLAAIYKRLGRRSSPSIHALCQEYDSEIPATALDQAKKALTGIHAGADTSTRINLLRKLGFPETAILKSVYDLESRFDLDSQFGQGKIARDAPSKDELYVRSAVILLNHPPQSLSASPRPIAAPRSRAGARAASPDRAGGNTSDPDH